MVEMPAFCPPNITIHDIWINHGVSHCFMDTVSSSIITGFLLVFGMTQLIIYRKYSTQIDHRRLQSSFLYKFQLFLMLLLAVIAGVRLDMRWKFYEEAEVYGYMVRRNFFKSIQFLKFIFFPPDSLHGFYDFRVSFRDLLGG